MGEIIVLLIFMALYFAPSIIARKKSFFGQVFVLNFFLGWSLIGWVVALIWAVKED